MSEHLRRHAVRVLTRSSRVVKNKSPRPSPGTCGIAAGYGWRRRGLAWPSAVAPAIAQVLVAGSRGTPESDLSPEQEQMLLGEYWTVAKRYRAEPSRPSPRCRPGRAIASARPRRSNSSRVSVPS